MGLRSLGKITVAASGTPVRLTVNESDPTARIGCQAIVINSLAGNTGSVYLGTSGFARSTGTGCMLIVAKGTTQQVGSQMAPAGLNAADYYLDADTNSDAAIVSVIEQ